MINVAVVGGGFMGSLHARCAARDPRANLAGIVDTNEESGRSLAERLETKYLRSVDEALEGDIDAFIVALPDRLHVETAVKLLRNGRSVLLEKPMADTLAGAISVAEAASEGGGRLMIGHILRFDPRYAMAAEAVHRGDIGEVVHLSAGRLGNQSIGLKLNGLSSVCFYIGVHDVDAVQWSGLQVRESHESILVPCRKSCRVTELTRKTRYLAPWNLPTVQSAICFSAGADQTLGRSALTAASKSSERRGLLRSMFAITDYEFLALMATRFRTASSGRKCTAS